MWKKVLLVGVAVVVLGVLGVLGLAAATQPNTFRIERKTTTSAPPEKIIAVLSDFHQWSAWSPWEKMDPGMKRTFGGSPSGVGAIYSWVGNDDVGEGRMTVTSIRPNERIDVKLEFIKPWQATNSVEFLLKPTGSGTEITWAMNGANDMMGKVFSLLMNMDAMVGKDFESGLSNLKTLVER